MSNKHEPHEAFILDALGRGVMKSQIVRELQERGLKTTGDEIRRWLERRVKRAHANAGMLEVLRSGVQSAAVGMASPTPSPVAAPTAKPVPVHAAAAPEVASRDAAPVTSPPFDPKAFMRRRTLNVEIPTEEELIKERQLDSVDSLKKQAPDNS